MYQISKIIGTSFDDMNCWDVVNYYYSQYDINIEDYKNYYPNNINKVWTPMKYPKKHALLAFDLEGRGNVTHVGIYIDGGKFIHATKHAGVCVEELGRYINRLVGIYAYKGGELID